MKNKFYNEESLRNNQGFTLVELLTVLVIIGVILAITIPNVSRLMYNQNDKKLHALIDSALKASNVYIDNYKKSFSDKYDRYNFQYESLLNINYVKEEDIHCTGTMQATRKKGNNYTYSAYLMCKDKKGNVIYDNTDDLPAGGVSIMGKFIIDYAVKLNNSSGPKYNHDYTKENVYNEFMAYDLERPGTSAGISKFMYSYNSRDWIDLACDQDTGTGSFILNNTYVGKIYFKAYDMVGNESETLSYNVKIDKIAPSGNITITSTNSNYNALSVRANISASDNTSGSGVKQMCIQESNNLASCNWVNYALTRNMTLSGTLNGQPRTIYVWFKDGASNISNVRSTTYTVYLECSQVNFSSWGNCNKVCGGGSQTRNAKDKFTSKACPAKNQSQSCNTRDCCGGNKVIGSYGSWGACNKACGGGTQTRPVYYVSKFDSKISCGNISDGSVSVGKQACNTQSCDPILTSYPQTFNLILPVRENVAIGFNTWGESASKNCIENSYVDATVITYSNGSLSFGPRTRIANNSGYYQLMGARLTDDKVIIYGNSRDCYSFGGSIGYQLPTASVVKIEGNKARIISWTYTNGEAKGWKAAYGFGCTSPYSCYASYWYCPNCTGSSFWTGGTHVNIDGNGYITGVEKEFSGKGWGHYEGDVENRLGLVTKKGNQLQPWTVYFPNGYKPIVIYNNAVYNSFTSTSTSYKILSNRYEYYEGATRLKSNELLLSVRNRNETDLKVYDSYMKIYNYDGTNLTLQKQIKTDVYFSGLIRLNDNAAIGYARPYRGEEGYSAFSSNARETYLFVK